MAKSELEALMAKIHRGMADHFLAQLESGEVSASDLNVMRQFLKDNGIDVLAANDPKITKLAEILPFQDPEEPVSVAE